MKPHNMKGLPLVATLKPLLGILAGAIGIGWLIDLIDVKSSRR